MAFLALIIAVVLIVAAIRNTHSQLLGALLQDVPGFAVWGAAIFGVAVIGFVPGLKPVSRGLLALVLVVIVLTNYQNILGGFTGLWKTDPAQASGGGDGGSDGGGGLGSLISSLGFNPSDFADFLGSDTSGASAQVNG